MNDESPTPDPEVVAVAAPEQPPVKPASETPAESTSPEAPAAEAPAPPTSASAPAEAAPAEAPPAQAATEAKPSERLRIGTQRADAAGEEPATDGGAPPVEDEALKPKPVHQVTESSGGDKAPKHYPPPNVREKLSAEQEAEFDAIMAGADVADTLDGAAAAAPTELAEGAKLKGKVARVHGDSVFVDLGEHREGVVPLKQFEPKKPATESKTESPAEGATEGTAEGAAAAEAKPDEVPAESKADESHAPDVGTELEVIVARQTEEGVYELSLPTAPIEVGNWDEVEVGQVVEVTITGKNKGGLECKVSGIRAFMPMGQISVYRVENPEEYVGQRLTAVVTEANRGKRNLILSHRAVMERERAAKREELLAELAPGQLRDGVVRSLRDFGAFVDLGGVDGMVHVSKLSWERVSHPKDVLTEGQQIKVKVEKVDRESGKIALSYREATANPWDTATVDFPVGDTVKGKVSKIMDFGAFVRLKPGVEGLVHISEFDYKRIHRASDVVSEGQEVEAKVLSVDTAKQRIALSMKALLAPPPPKKGDRPADEDMPLPKDAPKKPKRKHDPNLKGGIGGPSGGEKFGLKW